MRIEDVTGQLVVSLTTDAENLPFIVGKDYEDRVKDDFIDGGVVGLGGAR